MKCVRPIKSGEVIRVRNESAEQLVEDKKAVYVSKSEYKKKEKKAC